MTSRISKRVPLAYVSQMVVNALRMLKRPGGCNIEAIKSFIKDCRIQRSQSVLAKVPVALHRGVMFGAIKKYQSNYKLDSIMVMAAKYPQHMSLSPRLLQQARRKRHVRNKRLVKKKEQTNLANRRELLNSDIKLRS